MMNRWVAASSVSMVCAIAFGVGIAVTQCRSVDLRRSVSEADLERAPEGSTFRLGGIRWDASRYASDARLEPLRSFLRERCPGKAGLAAAVCLSDLFVQSFPQGTPAVESFSRDYDPVKALDAHMHGAPGYCVTRSGLITAILLASGMPARQVQYVAQHAGHTFMEVWEDGGWVFFDPSFGTVFRKPSGLQSATAALLHDQGTLEHFGRSAAKGDFSFERTADRIALRYPEPWLYTRTGESVATWPFRSRSEEIGAWVWRAGAAQPVFRASFLFFVVAAAFSAIRARRSAGQDVAAALSNAPARDEEESTPPRVEAA